MNVQRAYEDMGGFEGVVWMTPDTNPPMYAHAYVEPADNFQLQRLIVRGPLTEEQLGRAILDTLTPPDIDELPQDHEISYAVHAGMANGEDQILVLGKGFSRVIFENTNNKLWPPREDGDTEFRAQ